MTTIVEEENFSSKLKQAFDSLLERKYGELIPPSPIVTPFGIRHLDAILGGGLSSSSPIMFSSTPETGKSTLAFQFASIFQKTHPNSVVMYLDIEGSSNVENSIYFENRTKTFNIDESRFTYCPSVMNLGQIFSAIDLMIKLKFDFDLRINKAKASKEFETKLLIIWDSIAATPSTKETDEKVDNPNDIIGFRARELTFLINKYRQALTMNRITFLIIDQVRSNLKISGPFQQDEKTTGEFKNYKSATSVAALHHAVKQWMFFSKGKQLLPYDPLGIDGYEINIHMEKNKLAPSGITIPLLFDKKYGAQPLFSEYRFLSEMTKTESKNTKNNQSKLPYPLAIVPEANSNVIRIMDPSTGHLIKESDKFTERKLKDKYENDQEFKKMFDLAMKISVEERILKSRFEDRE